MADAKELLKICIEGRRVTVKAAAEQMGVPQSALWYWLRGASKPRDAGRRAIARWTRGKVPVSAWDSAA